MGAGGLGGAGGFGGMDPNIAAQMLENPAIAQSVSAMMSNPQFLEALLAQHPMGQDPMTRQILQNPEMRRMMMDPNLLRSTAQLSAVLGNLQRNQQPGVPPVANATSTTPSTGAQPADPFGSLFPPPSNSSAPGQQAVPSLPPMDPLFLQSLMTGFGGAAAGAGAAAGGGAATGGNTEPPEVRYQDQIRQLNDMGFWDVEKNLRAITLSGGNVHAAVDWLLNHP